MSGINVTVSTVMRAPIDIVAAFATSPDNAPIWCAEIEAVAWVTPRPLTLGTVVTYAAGRPATYTVTEFAPRTYVTFSTTDGPVLETTFAWVDVDADTTGMTLSHLVRPTRFLAVPAIRRAAGRNLEALRLLMEGLAGGTVLHPNPRSVTSGP